jgi:hypothetical protein
VSKSHNILVDEHLTSKRIHNEYSKNIERILKLNEAIPCNANFREIENLVVSKANSIRELIFGHVMKHV